MSYIDKIQLKTTTADIHDTDIDRLWFKNANNTDGILDAYSFKGDEYHNNYAGNLGWRWKSVTSEEVGENTIYTFTVADETSVLVPSDAFENVVIGDIVSIITNISYNYFGTVTGKTETTIDISRKTDTIPSGFDPASYANSGRLWCCFRPRAGYLPVGYGAVATGMSTIASEHGSFSCGSENTSDGWCSFSTGSQNFAGYCSSCLGVMNKTYGFYNTMTGRENVAEYGSNGTLTCGYKNTVKTNANFSFVGGEHNIANTEAQSVIGKYNSENADALFIVGNGTEDNARKNIFTANKDGSVSIDGHKLTIAETKPVMGNGDVWIDISNGKICIKDVNGAEHTIG